MKTSTTRHPSGRHQFRGPKLRTVQEQRSLENPAIALNDPSAFDALGISGRPVSSGIKVDRRAALTYDAIWRGVSLISNAVAKIPLHVYRHLGKGLKDPDLTHPAYRLLYRKPCPEMTSFIFRQTMMAHVLLQGNAYAYIFRDNAGRPIEIVPLCPHATHPVKVNGVLWYKTVIQSPDLENVGQAGTEPRLLRAEDVIHIRGLGYDGLMGYSFIEIGAETIGRGLASREYGSRFFANDAEPRVVIEVPTRMDKVAQEEFLRQWARMHQGIENSHRTAILTAGATLKPFSIAAKDAQLIDSEKFSVKTIANFLNLPPHKLGDSEKSSYNSLEMENKAVLNEGYDPWLVNWEHELADKLLSEEEKRTDSHDVGFVRDSLEQADRKSAAEADEKELNAGITTLDEVRAKRNLPPVPDSYGNKHRKPINIGYVDDPPPQAKPAGSSATQSDDEAAQTSLVGPDDLAPRMQAILADAWRRVADRLAKHTLRAATKPEGFLQSIDWIEKDHRVGVSEILAPAYGLYNAQAELVADVAAYFRSLRQDLLTLSGTCTAATLRPAVEAHFAVLSRRNPEIPKSRNPHEDLT
jgi:HK97 family phage portal protein